MMLLFSEAFFGRIGEKSLHSLVGIGNPASVPVMLFLLGQVRLDKSDGLVPKNVSDLSKSEKKQEKKRKGKS